MKHFVRSIFFLFVFNQSLSASSNDIFSLPNLSGDLVFKKIKIHYEFDLRKLELERDILGKCTQLSDNLSPCSYSADKYIKEYFSNDGFKNYEQEKIILQKCIKVCKKNSTKEEIATTYIRLINELKNEYKSKCDIYPLQNIKLTDTFLHESNNGLTILEQFENKNSGINRYVVAFDNPETFLNKAVIYTNRNHQVFEVVKLTSYIRSNKEFQNFRKNVANSIQEKYNNISSITSDEVSNLAFLEFKNKLHLISDKTVEFYTTLFKLPQKKEVTQSLLREEFLKYKAYPSSDDEVYNEELLYQKVLANLFQNDFNFISLSPAPRNFLIIRYVNKELLQNLIDEKDKFEKIKKEQIEHTEKNKIKEGL